MSLPTRHGSTSAEDTYFMGAVPHILKTSKNLNAVCNLLAGVIDKRELSQDAVKSLENVRESKDAKLQIDVARSLLTRSRSHDLAEPLRLVLSILTEPRAFLDPALKTHMIGTRRLDARCRNMQTGALRGS